MRWITISVLLAAGAAHAADEPAKAAKPPRHHHRAKKSPPGDEQVLDPSRAGEKKDEAAAPASPPPAEAAKPGAQGAAKPADAKPQAAQGELREVAPGASDRPWARSVPPETQAKAVSLFRDGNGLLKESLFIQAAEKYREALRFWDHPAIHYNLALALLNLDQPVEVFGHLEEAMKYGAAPLDADKFEHATRYRALIEKQLARVEVTCAQTGAQVSMDGRTLFDAPGRWAGLVRVGQHTVVATKPGYVAAQQTPTLLAGQKSEIRLQLFTAEELTIYQRRWAVWKPFTVLAAGVVVAAIGGILQWEASESYKSFDAGIQSCGGCVPPSDLQAKRSSGDALQATAWVGYSLGAAGAATGIALAILNRARPVRLSPEHEGRLSLAPLIGPGGAGLSGTVHF
jgi:tetratricopeptide (TPR) repeat protein